MGLLGFVAGNNLGFGRTKTTRNVTWGSILTLSQKKAQNSSKIDVRQKIR